MMKFTLKRNQLLNSLVFVTGVIESRQSMPILSHVLIRVRDKRLSLIGSDLGIELMTYSQIDSEINNLETTVSARKLTDICKALPDNSDIIFELTDNKVFIVSGKSRFSLMTLPAVDFPLAEMDKISGQTFSLSQAELLTLLESTAFAMGQKDVRYYLNGLSLYINNNQCCAIATDGHRLAMSQIALENTGAATQFILPRKTVTELLRLLSKEKDSQLTLKTSSNAIHFESNAFSFVSRLIEGNVPDYRQTIPTTGDKRIIIDRDSLKQALQRAAILANEKYHAVSLRFETNKLVITAVNSEQEEAVEELALEYTHEPLEFNLNVNYLLDVLAIVPAGEVVLTLSTPDDSVLIHSDLANQNQFVIMPMSL